jgi:hypothetical protein
MDHIVREILQHNKGNNVAENGPDGMTRFVIHWHGSIFCCALKETLSIVS